MNAKREYVMVVAVKLVRTMAVSAIVSAGFLVMFSAAIWSGFDSARGRMSKWSSKDAKVPLQVAANRSKSLPDLDDLY